MPQLHKLWATAYGPLTLNGAEEVLRKVHGQYPSQFPGAHHILTAMGFSLEEIVAICEDALTSLQGGKRPYWVQCPRPFEEPVTRQQVIDRLKAWRAKNRIGLNAKSSTNTKPRGMGKNS